MISCTICTPLTPGTKDQEEKDFGWRLSTFLSSVLPTTAIYFVKAPLARLAAVMAFTALFSLTLRVVAKARKVEVFVATTA